MPIVRNTTFAGSSIYAVDPGALTLASVMRNAQADTAGVVAHLTDDTIPTHIDHSGPGRGCVLGIPAVVQRIYRPLDLVAGAKLNGGVDGTARMQFPFLIYVPPGESSVLVEVNTAGVTGTITASGERAPEIFARLSSAVDFALAVGSVIEQQMTTIDVVDERLFSARFDGIPLPGFCLLTISVPAIYTSSASRLIDVVVRFPRGAGVPVAPFAGDASNPTGVVAPASTEALFHQPMDEAIFSTFITGWHASRLDRNINGALEYLTGAPAGGNALYTHTESALRSPTRDRFGAATRRTFANEPIPKIPICSVNFGGIKSDGGYLVDPTVPAEVNARQSYAPYAPSAALIDLGVQRMSMPDVVSGRLSVAILLGQNAGVGWTNTRVRPQVEGLVPPTAIAPTPVTGASHLALAVFTGVPHNRDSVLNRLRIGVSQSGGTHTATTHCLLAACAWIE